MSNAAKQWYSLSEQQLEKLVGQGTYPRAGTAWDRVREIREAGGLPKVFYSKFNGFSVLDENDRESMRKLMAIESHAKRFPG